MNFTVQTAYGIIRLTLTDFFPVKPVGKIGTIANPLNHNKGCGSVMRVSPLALCYGPENLEDLLKLDMTGAEIAAVIRIYTCGNSYTCYKFVCV